MTAEPGASDGAPRKTLSVCLLGQPFWARRVEAGLNRYGGPLLHAFYLDSWRFLPKAKEVFAADILLRMGFRPGARTLRGRAFDALWRTLRLLNPSALGVFYWLGTDVLNTVEELRIGKLRSGCYLRAKKDLHLADAPWLVEELQTIGIKAILMPITMSRMRSTETPDLPREFAVLTYIPDARYRFYGGDCIYQAAKQLPGIRFDVVGGRGTWVPAALPNLKFHGWQADMAPFYRKATVVVRMVQHDGTGMTVIEGLCLARHAIYSFPMPCTLPVAWGDSPGLIQRLRSLLDLHDRGLLRANVSGRKYAMEEFDGHRSTATLISYLLDSEASRGPRRSARDVR